MSSLYIQFLLLSSLFFTLSLSSPIFLPLSKDPQTNQYLTQIFHTSRLLPTTLVLDLNSPFLWLGIPQNNNINDNSVILRRSIECSAIGLDQSGPLDEQCSFPVLNPVTGEFSTGQLGRNEMSLDQSGPLDEFLYVSVPSILLTGLTQSSKGVFGLGRNRVGVVEQVSHNFKLSKKFSLCLSSSFSNGFLLFGENTQIEAFNSMIYTPILMGSDNGDSYYINLKSVNIQNKKIPLQKPSKIQISTISPYTLIESELYDEVLKVFATESDTIGMARANPVGQFELCYKMKEISEVPIVDLVLQSEMVKWRIIGHNSMVKMIDGVMCLGILDGGDKLGASIVLGNHQLEDNLVEFDLGRSMIGFSSSLVTRQTSCSLLSSSLRKDVQSL